MSDHAYEIYSPIYTNEIIMHCNCLNRKKESDIKTLFKPINGRVKKIQTKKKQEKKYSKMINCKNLNEEDIYFLLNMKCSNSDESDHKTFKNEYELNKMTKYEPPKKVYKFTLLTLFWPFLPILF